MSALVTLFAVSLPRAVLSELLAHAAKVTDQHSALPMLRHAQLTAAAGGGLTVCGTDLAATYVGRRPAEVRVAGSVCANARWLRDVVAAMPDGAVEVTATAKAGRVPTELHVSSPTSRRRFRLHVLAGEDYPEVAHAGGPATLLDGAATALLIRTVRHAIDGHRFPAVYVHFEGRTLRAEAASASRVSWAACEAAREAAPEAGRCVQIPEHLIGRLPPLEGDVSMAADEHRVTLDVGEDRWTCKVAPDDPPNLGIVRDKIAAAASLVRVDRRELLDALNATALAATRDAVAFECLPGERAIRLTASSLGVEVGKRKTGRKVKVMNLLEDEEESVYSNDACADELAAAFEGAPPPATFQINRHHAAQALAALACDRVVLRLGEPGTPASIYDPADDASCEVIALMGAA